MALPAGGKRQAAHPVFSGEGQVMLYIREGHSIRKGHSIREGTSIREGYKIRKEYSGRKG